MWDKLTQSSTILLKLLSSEADVNWVLGQWSDLQLVSLLAPGMWSASGASSSTSTSLSFMLDRLITVSSLTASSPTRPLRLTGRGKKGGGERRGGKKKK